MRGVWVIARENRVSLHRFQVCVSRDWPAVHRQTKDNVLLASQKHAEKEPGEKRLDSLLESHRGSTHGQVVCISACQLQFILSMRLRALACCILAVILAVIALVGPSCTVIALDSLYTIISMLSAPRVRIFLFNKDSPELLHDWLMHHTSVFGADNIHVLDHSSTDPIAVAALRMASARGVHVTIRSGPFTHKTTMLSDLMRTQVGRADFLVPLDVDEFMGTYRNRLYSFSVYDIRAEFRLLWSSALDGKTMYKFGMAYPVACNATACRFSIASPAALNLSFSGQPFSVWDKKTTTACDDKTFYPAATFSSTDQGNHFGMLLGDKHPARRCAGISRSYAVFPDHHGLILAHLSRLAMPYEMYRRKMHRGAEVYGFTPSSKCGGRGQHYCRFLKTNVTSKTFCARAARLPVCNESLGQPTHTQHMPIVATSGLAHSDNAK